MAWVKAEKLVPVAMPPFFPINNAQWTYNNYYGIASHYITRQGPVIEPLSTSSVDSMGGLFSPVYKLYNATKVYFTLFVQASLQYNRTSDNFYASTGIYVQVSNDGTRWRDATRRYLDVVINTDRAYEATKIYEVDVSGYKYMRYEIVGISQINNPNILGTLVVTSTIKSIKFK